MTSAVAVVVELRPVPVGITVIDQRSRERRMLLLPILQEFWAKVDALGEVPATG